MLYLLSDNQNAFTHQVMNLVSFNPTEYCIRLKLVSESVEGVQAVYGRFRFCPRLTSQWNKDTQNVSAKRVSFQIISEGMIAVLKKFNLFFPAERAEIKGNISGTRWLPDTSQEINYSTLRNNNGKQ